MNDKRDHLDPQVKALLDATSGPAWDEFSIEKARELFQNGVKAVAGDALPAHAMEDWVLPLEGRELKARLFRPSAEARLPVIVYYHGGGFVLGGEGSHDNLCRRICKTSGALVLNVDYRMAPEHPFPAAVYDAFDTIIWLQENEDNIGCDVSRLALCGDSAGGNLATVTAIMMRDAGMVPAKAQAMLYPITDTVTDTGSYLKFAEGYRLSRKQMELFLETYLPSQSDYESPLVAPLRTSDLSGLPPALIVIAGCDPLRDEARAYAERLREEGNEVEEREFAGMIHAFCNMCGVLDVGREAVEQSSRWLREKLFW